MLFTDCHENIFKRFTGIHRYLEIYFLFYFYLDFYTDQVKLPIRRAQIRKLNSLIGKKNTFFVHKKKTKIIRFLHYLLDLLFCEFYYIFMLCIR